MMFAYSPRKNRPNDIDEYSAKKPATSSDSPSGRSNGTRLVSASAETKKMTAIGASMPKAYQFQKYPLSPRWLSMIWLRLSECAANSTVMMTKPMDTSYDTICAAERSAPRNGYLELLAQPAMMTP